MRIQSRKRSMRPQKLGKQEPHQSARVLYGGESNLIPQLDGHPLSRQQPPEVQPRLASLLQQVQPRTMFLEAEQRSIEREKDIEDFKNTMKF